MYLLTVWTFPAMQQSIYYDTSIRPHTSIFPIIVTIIIIIIIMYLSKVIMPILLLFDCWSRWYKIKFWGI